MCNSLSFKCNSDTCAFVAAGDKDWLRHAGAEVLKSFENNVTINHRFGHTVPRLGAPSLCNPVPLRFTGFVLTLFISLNIGQP